MQLRKITLPTFLLSALISSNLHAAEILEVWNNANELPILNNYYFDNTLAQNLTAIFQSSNKNRHAAQSFSFLKTAINNGASHTRYVQRYLNIPVWGMQLIVHHKTNTKVTGQIVTGIEKDIKTTQAKFNSKQAEAIAFKFLKNEFKQAKLSAPRYTKTSLMIYLDKNNDNATSAPAKLAYLVTFFSKNLSTQKLLRPVFIIDALTGKKLFYYDNIQYEAIGTGPGGNNVTGLGFRSTNHYQFGNAPGGLPALGFLPVANNGVTCTMETPSARLISWHNATSTDNDFPVNFDEEASHPVFAYTCGGSPYQNANDNSESPIVTGSAQAYSPNNDVFYFGDQNYTMLRAYLPDVMQPWGDNLPIRMYTHVANLDNAFAISPVNPAPETDMNDNNFNAQFVVGNGLNTNYPFSDAGTVGHELAHIFTAYAANLIYANQSGGINEAYSDITGKAYEDYVFRQYPWYGETWGGGLSIVLPTVEDKNSEYRHMNNPPLDGNSIDNLSKYVQGMNVHFSSGVFNKAFFLMVDGHGIDVVQGFKYFSYANINYWTPGTNFEHASCGVIEAAIDMQQSEAVAGIKSSFEEVGVHCKVGFKQLKTPL